MKDFPLIWFLFYTSLGRTILGIVIGYLVIMLVGWWLIPITAALIGAALLLIYYTPPITITDEENGRKDKTNLKWGIGLLVFAALFVLGLWGYQQWEKALLMDSGYRPMWPQEVETDTIRFVPQDTIIMPEEEEPKANVKKASPSGSSYSPRSEKSREYDNMRGFDPASEDEMDDNGMNRYMENDDDEGRD